MESAAPRLRLSILGIVVLSLFGALFARLWYLQVMAAPELQVQAEANRVRTVVEEAPRGIIYDAQGRPLVENRTSLVVTIDQDAFDDDQVLEVAETLTRFGVPTKVSRIENRLSDPQYNPLEPVPVANDVPAELELYLAERADQYPGVAVERQTVRSYPHGELAAHLLGYVGRINEEEYAALQGSPEEPKDNPKPYQLDSSIGKGGVERSFEADLRGTPGVRTLEVDSAGRTIRTIDYQAPVPGNDIQLTVDIDTQAMAEQALAEQLERLRGRYSRDGENILRSPAGSVVVLDPNSGGVIAMASYPTFNPSEFVNGISQTRYDQLTKSTEIENPLVNRAVQGLYAPGSTFKPFTAYSALAAGMISPQDSYNDRGVYEMPDRDFTNAGSKAYGMVDLERSLAVSSDVYYYWLGNRFFSESDEYGPRAMQDGYVPFGFGSPTGIALPGEPAGVIPDAALFQAIYDAGTEADKAAGDPTWRPGDQMITAIGQGQMLATPLQLADAYAALANGGTVYRPELLLRVLVPGGDPADPADVVREATPEVISQFDLPASMRDPIVRGLEGVVSSSEGTAYETFLDFDLAGFRVAGKTGTAEVDDKADTSVFASFAPVEAPRYVAVAILEEAGFGGEAAAPVVRRVYEQLSGQEITDAGDIQAGSE
jgi:penicillin-binding protein 2